MKKITKFVLVALLAIGCASTASAQFRFGIKAGLNVNKMHLNEKTFDADNGCGFTGGLMTEFQIPVIGLCFDASVMYTRMNSAFEKSGIESAGSGDVIVNDRNGKIGKDFLEIPINIKYKFTLPVVSSLVSPYLFTGPSFAFKLDKNSLESIKTKTCQTAWNVGVGVELIRHLQVGASYGFGMNNVAKWAVPGINTTEVKAKNNYWTITAAYLF